MNKKIITLLLATVAIVSISATTVIAAPHYVDTCCDTDGFGGARKRCTLPEPVLVGASCACTNVRGNLFGCYGF